MIKNIYKIEVLLLDWKEILKKSIHKLMTNEKTILFISNTTNILLIYYFNNTKKGLKERKWCVWAQGHDHRELAHFSVLRWTKNE